ncbi:MAG: membrane protein insertion efficiency factor YidD [Candidatus Omnitrophota bacterium]
MFDKILAFPFVVLIRFYQAVLSPVLGHGCRHVPSCSEYLLEAIRVHGVVKGNWLGLRRLLRCHPWGTAGYDPVPPRRDP